MAAAAKINIIRKMEVVEGHGHHGGAWKVAYADFMTAMMAFFLLMWILSSSDEQKLRGIAEYFTNATMPGGSGVLDGATLGPPGTLNASNGATVARGSDLGKMDSDTPARWEVRDVTPTSDPQQKVSGNESGPHEYPAGGEAASEFKENPAQAGKQATAGESDRTGKGDGTSEHADDLARFESLKTEIVQAMQDSPDLAPLKKNVMFEQTPEGLRIQVIDQHGKPMFASGSSDMPAATQKLLNKMGEAIAKLPNKVAISGHTDAVPFSVGASYDNWDLSSDRANATRRILERSGVNMGRIIQVTGKAATELLVQDNPKDPSNRRISVLLQFDTPPMTADTPDTPSPETEPTKRADGPKDAKPAMVEERDVTQLDQNVFENLRSALR